VEEGCKRRQTITKALLTDAGLESGFSSVKSTLVRTTIHLKSIGSAAYTLEALCGV